MDRHEFFLCGALILVIVAGVAVRQMKSGPDAEPVLIEAPDSLPDHEGASNLSFPDQPSGQSPSAIKLPSGLKDINLATAIDLQQVSGIGPTLSRNILEHRNAHGPFQTMDELQEVSGIGAERLKRLKEQFTVSESIVPDRADSPGSEPGEGTSARQPLRETRDGRIDLNSASAQELEALPGVGPVLAGAIVEHREHRGLFQSVEQLREVSGIGPRRYEQLAPLVVAGATNPNAPLHRLNLPDAPPVFPSSTPPSPFDKFGESRTRPIDLNKASTEQLESLPGIGEVLARRIVEYRTLRGGFRSPEELKNVNGIGDKKYAQIRPLIEVP